MIVNYNLFFVEVEQFLTEGGDVTILVKGNSMRPLLRDRRDKVIMCRHTDADIKCGAIMLFRHNGTYVMHRVVRIDGDTIVFEGDGNYKRKEIVTRSDIIALVKTIIRPSGRSVECSSRCWHTMSRMWLILPRELRRIILGVMRRIKI